MKKFFIGTALTGIFASSIIFAQDHKPLTLRSEAAAVHTVSANGKSSLIKYTTVKSQKSPAETQICYGPAVQTEDMHNHVIGGGPQDPDRRNFANAGFVRYQLTVTAPRGWHFSGEPYVNLVSGDKSGFDWNNFPAAHDRFFITARTPNSIVATCWAGSHPMLINLACQATQD